MCIGCQRVAPTLPSGPFAAFAPWSKALRCSVPVSELPVLQHVNVWTLGLHAMPPLSHAGWLDALRWCSRLGPAHVSFSPSRRSLSPLQPGELAFQFWAATLAPPSAPPSEYSGLCMGSLAVYCRTPVRRMWNPALCSCSHTSHCGPSCACRCSECAVSPLFV